MIASVQGWVCSFIHHLTWEELLVDWVCMFSITGVMWCGLGLAGGKAIDVEQFYFHYIFFA